MPESLHRKPLYSCQIQEGIAFSEIRDDLASALEFRYSLRRKQGTRMSTAKHDVSQLLNKLPDDCSIEDIQYHLYVLEKVRRGLDDAKANGTLSQQEVESRLSKWLTE